MVPIIRPPPPPPSRAPLLLTLLVAALGGWGLLKWREARQHAEGPVAASSAVEDADYFDLAVGSVVQDAQMEFRRLGDNPEANRAARDDLLKRFQGLKIQMATAPLTDAHRDALNQALDDVLGFVKTQVNPLIEPAPAKSEAALAKATAPGAAATPVAAATKGSAPGATTTVVVAEATAEHPVVVADTAKPAGQKKLDQTLLKHANTILATLPH
jgi:hypothetical protein